MRKDGARHWAKEMEKQADATPPASRCETLDIAPIIDGPMVVFSDPVPPMAAEVAHAAPFGSARVRSIPREGDTEDLLNGLIAECHFLMREVALPTAIAVRDADTRARFLSTAMSLAHTGAKVGRIVAKLRGAGAVTELRQRHVVEHVVTTPAPSTEKELRT